MCAPNFFPISKGATKNPINADKINLTKKYTIQPANQSFLSNLFFRHSFLIIFYHFFQINYIRIVHDNVHSTHKKRLSPQRFSIFNR